MNKISNILLFAAIFALFQLNAQNTRIEWYHQEDGLPNDLVKSINVDSTGFVWVATDDGLVKIVGRNFQVVNNPRMFSNNFKSVFFSNRYGVLATADPGLLKINEFFDGIRAEYFQEEYALINWPKLIYPKTIYESNDSSVWFADLKNVYQLNDEKVQTFEFDSKNHTDHFSRTYQFFEIGSKYFFVLSQKGFLYSYDKGKQKFDEIQWSYNGSQIYTVTKYSNQSVLVGCDAGLLLLQFDKKGFILEVKNFQFEHPVSVIKKNADNKFLIGTWGFGAYELNIQGLKYSHELIEGSQAQTINDIEVDKQGQIWLGTNNGVMLYRHVLFNEPFGELTKLYIQDIRIDKQGNTYFSDGRNVYLVDKEMNQSVFYKSLTGLIITLAIDDKGIWMGTNDGKLIFKDFYGELKTYDYSKKGNGIYNIGIDRNKCIWIIQAQPYKEALLRIDELGRVKDYTPVMSSDERIRSLKISPKGEVYIGATSQTNYLFKYDFESDTLLNLSFSVETQYDDPFSVIDIAFADSGNLYLATKFGVWNYRDDSIYQLNFGDMTNEMVTAINIDGYKNLWFANSNGVIRYEAKSLTIFDNTNGLPAKTTNYRCLNISDDNVVWVGTISGLAVGVVGRLAKSTPKPIVVRFEKSGQQVEYKKYNRFVKNSILDLSVATSVYPANYVRYRYSVSKKGVIGNWVELPLNKDNIILNNLLDGDYTLKIIAKNRGHYSWSDPFEYHFSVYKNWYARSGVLVVIYLFVFIAIWLYTIYNKKKSEKERKKLELIIDSRTKDLQDQNEELKQLNANLRIAKEESEAAIKTKDRFFSIVSHDLKSPFNTLIGFSELMVHNRDNISDEVMQQLSKEMLKTSENTYKLLQNLLDWSRAQTGSIKIEKQTFYINDLMKDILPIVKPMAKQKQIELLVDCTEDQTIYGDISMVDSIIRNLVSNAIKFSNSQTNIKIQAKVSGKNIEISVIDKGVGIPIEHMEKLFAIDENVSTQGTENEMGTGLGLVLCKEFAMQNGGDIFVKSKLGTGSVFTVVLPNSEN